MRVIYYKPCPGPGCQMVITKNAGDDKWSDHQHIKSVLRKARKHGDQLRYQGSAHCVTCWAAANIGEHHARV